MTELQVDFGNIHALRVSDNLDVAIEGDELHVQSLINSNVIDDNFTEVEARLSIVDTRLSEMERRLATLIHNLQNIRFDL